MNNIKKGFKFLRIKQLVGRDWKKRFGCVFKLHPEYQSPLDKALVKQYCDYWGQFGERVNSDTLKVCHNLSGSEDIRMIPEEIFSTIIDDSLNPDPLMRFFAHKSFYDHWHPKGIFPKTYLHNISGLYMNNDYQQLSAQQAVQSLDQIQYPVVVKPNRDSHGGKDVYFADNSDQARDLIANNKNFVVQEKILQHPYFNKYNDKGINSVRVCMYRTTKTDSFVFLNATLRMGRGGSLDNETAGGIACYINEQGYLNEYALDKYAGKFFEHPDNQIRFADDGPIPDLEGMKKTAKIIADEIFIGRLMSLDMTYDEHNQWRLIEIGLRGHTTRFTQYAGVPFFGEYTDEVIEFCKQNLWYKN